MTTIDISKALKDPKALKVGDVVINIEWDGAEIRETVALVDGMEFVTVKGRTNKLYAGSYVPAAVRIGGTPEELLAMMIVPRFTR